MTLVARPLAGPGRPGTVLDLLKQAGWTVTTDDKANAYAFTGDHRVIACFLPERNDFAPPKELWVIRAYGDLNEIIWEAAFTADTPAEFVAAFMADLIKPEPLDPDRDDDAPLPATRGGHDTACTPPVADQAGANG